jgi:hypothetical protein
MLRGMAACGDRDRVAFPVFRPSACCPLLVAREDAALGVVSLRAERAEDRAVVFAFAMRSLLEPNSQFPTSNFQPGWQLRLGR